jgi:tetrahydromethanopterin S-methyltransferase subunit B
MKNRALTIYTLLFAAIFCMNGQKKKLENPFETNGDLNSQFLYLEKTSTNYKEYKVITKRKFMQLHKNVMDSMAIQHNILNQQQAENNKQLAEINKLNSALTSVNTELQEASTNRDLITVMGIGMYKNNYNLIVGIIILSLLATTLLFFYKFTNSNVVTKEAKAHLKESQNEYEAHKKSSLTRQQEISRKLQDEIIKNRKD